MTRADEGRRPSLNPISVRTRKRALFGAAALEVSWGITGVSTAASAMMAGTHTISSKAKPRSVLSFIFRTGDVFKRKVGCDAAAALLAVGSVGQNIVRAVLSRRAVQIGIIPRVVGDV